MIPVTVITGFLGSGKTSLVAHLLDSTEDRSVAVIVNDMAAESLDSAFLRGGEHIQSGNEGLIRTVVGGRAGAGREEELIWHVLSLASHTPTPEAIVIETSGSSPAAQLSQLVSSDSQVSAVVYLDSVITVVDTTTFAMRWKDRQLQPLLADQLSAADLIVLNKYDRSSLWSRMQTRRILRAFDRSANTAVVTAEFGRLAPEEVINTGRWEKKHETAPSVAPEGSGRIHQPLVARQLDERRPFHPQRFEEWLNGAWQGIIRVKGFFWLATDMSHVYVVDSAGPQREIGMEGTWYAALPEDEVPADEDVQKALSVRPYGDRRQAITVIGVPDAVEREMRALRNALLTVTEMDRGPTGWSGLPDPIAPRFIESNEGSD